MSENGSTNPPYVQVPSSSPIHVLTSPNERNGNDESSSGVSLRAVLDEEKQRDLEAKRMAIRNHPYYAMLRKGFFYLLESDIFKGFVKGKGNLRDITTWLQENFDRDAMVARYEQERAVQAAAEYQRQQQQRNANGYNPTTNGVSNAAPSTKVEVLKQKSIAERYNNTDTQGAIPRFSYYVFDPVTKKRKLVKGSKYTLPTSPSGFGLTSRVVPAGTINYMRNQSGPTNSPHLSSLYPLYSQPYGLALTQHPVVPARKKLKKAFRDEDLSDMIVAEDDLEKIEAKIRRNRRLRAAKSMKISDDEMEDEDDDLEEEGEEEDENLSDEMSDEDGGDAYEGVTSIDTQVLEFLNSASVDDIVEICNIPPKTAEIIISKRPFIDIYQVTSQEFEAEEAENGDRQTKRRYKKKTLGQRVVENTEFSLKGYKAVDSLVKKCSEYGELISKQMKQWGVSVDSNHQDGLDVVEMDPVNDEVVVDEEGKQSIKYLRDRPALFAEDMELKNYQQVGINWLNVLYHNKLSCILADEMGLGKTCQVIAFMAHLKQVNEPGPHLVIVPSSTLENWLREFKKFCPSLVVKAYYGSQREREDLRYDLELTHYDVLVTTYNLATGAPADFKFLKHCDFNMIVYDEGHLLKNSSSDRYTKLMRLKAKFRLLLTGTPLQNNLKELVSLLSFMLPNLFSERREDLHGLFNKKASTINADEDYNPLLSQQAIAKAKTMMTPFVLRRKKSQVLTHLPGKTNQIKYCELTPSQKEIYLEHLNKGKATRKERERRKLLTGKEAERARAEPITSSSNVMMALRKAALHPLLFRKLYDGDKLKQMAKDIMKEPEYVEANEQYIYEDMEVMSDYELNNLCVKFPTLSKYVLEDKEWLNSGKVGLLMDHIKEIMARKERVLVFSLFTQVLDILEKVLTIGNIKFLRLDGQTSVDTRQDLIDTFYDDDTIPVFLLSTKAGGFGINLVAANNVIIFDQSFNPHDDRQAEDRAHRVGQTSEVLVTRFISKGTIEENMLQLAENKLQLDQSISSSEVSESKMEDKAVSMFEKILFDE